jgi:hypothetical protein
MTVATEKKAPRKMRCPALHRNPSTPGSIALLH